MKLKGILNKSFKKALKYPEKSLKEEGNVYSTPAAPHSVFDPRSL